MDENSKTKLVPRVINKGFNSHDCESRYQCPLCDRNFGSWMVDRFEKRNGHEHFKCPFCASELRT